MAVDLVKPPGAAAMRASAEMQQTTIGGDSDVDGSERPRKKKTRREPQLVRKQRERARAMQATAQETDGSRADVVASGGDGNDGD